MHPVIKKVAARAVLRGTMDYVAEPMIEAASAYAIELNKLYKTDPDMAQKLLLEQIDEMEQIDKIERGQRRKRR